MLFSNVHRVLAQDVSRQRIGRVLGIGLSLGCVALLALRVDWHRFIGDFSGVAWRPLASAIPLVVLTYALFALRWRLLLSIEPKPPVMQLFRYLMLGYLANVALPMRAGDGLRVVLLRRACGHGITRAASSIGLERLLDVLTLLAMAFMVALYADLPNTILTGLRAAGIAAAAAVSAVFMIAVRPQIAIAAAGGISRRFAPRLHDPLMAQARHFIDAIGVLVPRDRRGSVRVAAAVALGLAGWASYALGMALCMASFGVQPAIVASLLLVVVTNLGAAIPSSPASIGVYHALGVLALSPWHVRFDLALAAVTATHAVTVGVQVALGMLALALGRAPSTASAASALSDRGG
ncbi:MAG TPA: lysylphosphatidylglycerol synthase transmembrane domain-containing protein [Casimicrobiaceae bacterium]|nr:lysylphosphatidylglycerol synthase transmembrane domain-containing protein [Casimicrobiaceae bacterium]